MISTIKRRNQIKPKSKKLVDKVKKLTYNIDLDLVVPKSKNEMITGRMKPRIMVIDALSEIKVLSPMLAAPGEYNDNYLDCFVEEKLDGERLIVKYMNNNIETFTRKLKTHTSYIESVKINMNITFTDGQTHAVILDGELIYYVDGSYVPIVKVGNKSTCKKEYHIFDVQYYDGWVIGKSFDERRKLLETIKENEFIKHSRIYEAVDVKSRFEDIVKRGGEGLIVKPKQSLYKPDDRTTWIKLKALNIVENRCDFDVNVVKIYKNKRGEFAILEYEINGVLGRVSSGINRRDMFEFKTLVDEFGTPKCKIIAEIKGDLITDSGKIRHPIFVRLRKDLL